MTLSLDTAYRSFGGEVEASSTPTICRLPDSRRHQLSAIAPSGKGGPLGHLSGFGLDRSICGSVTACERRRDASEVCALEARSRTNRGEPMPRRSLALRGIQHPSSDKTPASQVLGRLAGQSLESRPSLTEL